jgi:hypothetical protein
VSDAGVVGPIRAPEGYERLIRSVPLLAWVFIALTILDVLGRWIGVISPGLNLAFSSPAGLVTAFLPHDALILLPAVVVLRRRDAETATPLILWGAVIVALVELLWRPTESIVSDAFSSGSEGPIVIVTIVGAIATAVGWIVLGRGLSVLNTREPRDPIRGLANIAALMVAGSVAINLVWILLRAPNLAGLDSTGEILVIQSAVALSALGWAYFTRAVLLGLEDPGRSVQVARLAGIGVLLSAVASLVAAVVTAVASANIQVAVDLETTLGIPIVVASALGVTLVVVAFGLGLADPLRPLPAAWEAQN